MAEEPVVIDLLDSDDEDQPPIKPKVEPNPAPTDDAEPGANFSGRWSPGRLSPDLIDPASNGPLSVPSSIGRASRRTSSCSGMSQVSSSSVSTSSTLLDSDTDTEIDDEPVDWRLDPKLKALAFVPMTRLTTQQLAEYRITDLRSLICGNGDSKIRSMEVGSKILLHRYRCCACDFVPVNWPDWHGPLPEHLAPEEDEVGFEQDQDLDMDLDLDLDQEEDNWKENATSKLKNRKRKAKRKSADRQSSSNGLKVTFADSHWRVSPTPPKKPLRKPNCKPGPVQVRARGRPPGSTNKRIAEPDGRFLPIASGRGQPVPSAAATAARPSFLANCSSESQQETRNSCSTATAKDDLDATVRIDLDDIPNVRESPIDRLLLGKKKAKDKGKGKGKGRGKSPAVTPKSSTPKNYFKLTKTQKDSRVSKGPTTKPQRLSSLPSHSKAEEEGIVQWYEDPEHPCIWRCCHHEECQLDEISLRYYKLAMSGEDEFDTNLPENVKQMYQKVKEMEEEEGWPFEPVVEVVYGEEEPQNEDPLGELGSSELGSDLGSELELMAPDVFNEVINDLLNLPSTSAALF